MRLVSGTNRVSTNSLGRCGLRGACGCAAPCNGLGLNPSMARATSQYNPEGLGALPGPSLMEELLAQVQAVFGSFLQLEAELLQTQRRLLEAIRLAESKRQGRLQSEAQSAYRASVNLLSRYRETKMALAGYLDELRKLKADYAAGTVGIVGVGLATARIAFQMSFQIRSANALLSDVPRFSQTAAALIERINGALSLTPATPITNLPGIIFGNAAQIAMWTALGIAAVTVLPRVLPKRRTA